MTNKVKLNQSVEISDDVKFGIKDIFNRKDFGESLSNLILNSQNESLVISINADWGEGKTDFLKRWNNFLKDEKGLNTIYFNSFKNDFIEDPFLALLGEILNSNSYKGNTAIYDEIKEKGINILKGIGPLTGKIAARWLMKGDNEQISNDLEELIEGDIAKEIEKKLDKYLTKETEIKDFKKALKEIIEKSEGKQLVFIIDELDRCRPDFALRLLERIKHFFNIEGLYFVLGINKNQIEAYITKIYGNIDSKTYLQKFIDIETILPKNIEVGGDIEKYIHSKVYNQYKEVFEEKDDTNSLLNEKTDLLILFSETLNLNFRQIDKIINYLVLFRKSLEKLNNYFNTLLIILIVLKVIDINEYNNLKMGKLNKGKILTILKINDFPDGNYKKQLKETLDFFITTENEMKELEVNQFMKGFLNSYNFDYSYFSLVRNRLRFLQKHINFLEYFNI